MTGVHRFLQTCLCVFLGAQEAQCTTTAGEVSSCVLANFARVYFLNPAQNSLAYQSVERREFCNFCIGTFSNCAKSLRAKHHVVVQYMAAGWKCPLPPPPPQPPFPLPKPPCS